VIVADATALIEIRRKWTRPACRIIVEDKGSIGYNELA